MKDWRNTIVKFTDSIRHVMEVIDSGSLQIALVVDSHKKLIGTVTDGDIRRGIIKRIDLDTEVSQIMNKTPVTVEEGYSLEEVQNLMNGAVLRQIPVVNSKGQVVDVVFADSFLKSISQKENFVVLMAGGLGQRLRPLTTDTPKPLLKVGEKPILQTILESFVRDGFKNFYISVRYKAEKLKEFFGDGSRWNVNISYLDENEELGTAGCLSLLPQKPTKPLIVMNGDLLTKVNYSQLLDFHIQQKVAATMCVGEYEIKVPFGVVELDSKQRIRALDEKPVQRFFVNAGIYVIEPETLSLIPKTKTFNMTSLFDKLVQMGRDTAVFPLREYWLDIGRKDDFEKANQDYPENFE